MFNVFLSNNLSFQKDILIELLKKNTDSALFQKEFILIQSNGMSQWLKLEIAKSLGICANIAFPFLNSFIWQQYSKLLRPDAPFENVLNRTQFQWSLFKIIPDLLDKKEFAELNNYLTNDPSQKNIFQLASKIAEIFDQYIIYRPNWLLDWENDNIQNTINDLRKHNQNLQNTIQWQAKLWKILVKEISNQTQAVESNHRAKIHQQFIDKLKNLSSKEKDLLPKRIFIFGISSIPPVQLDSLIALSKEIEIILFFNNPSEKDWWNDHYSESENTNPLLLSLGKQGREFINDLVKKESEFLQLHEANYPIIQEKNPTLLQQLKQSINDLENNTKFACDADDHSIQIHHCHSKMREIEILHNQLLNCFANDPDLVPNDIVVMIPNIDSYTPYINSVFNSFDYSDPRFIPFAISDQKISLSSEIINCFLEFLDLEDLQFNAEQIVNLLKIPAIQEKFKLSENELKTITEWLSKTEIRFGLNFKEDNFDNFNSWEQGLDRIVLGFAMEEKNNNWQNLIALDESYGNNSEIAGKLLEVIRIIKDWFNLCSEKQSIELWENSFNQLVSDLFEESNIQVLHLKNTITECFNEIKKADLNEKIEIDVLKIYLTQKLNSQLNSINFLSGKVNFCTLLPMRTIPFKIVCLIGMNESDFPHQNKINSINLMQLAPKFGDRIRKDEDRYLFLEAILSAQNILYISFIAHQLHKNQNLNPSIFVSQLKDYINSNSENITIDFFHPATKFSPENYQLNYKNYNKEWAIHHKDEKNIPIELDEFESEKPNVILIDDLINYISSPIKYFFEKNLNAKFIDYQTELSTSEHFELNHLEQFKLKEEFLLAENTEDFFKNAKLKGKLMLGNFNLLEEENIKSSIIQLKEQTDQFFIDPQTRHFNLEIDAITLTGQFNIAQNCLIERQVSVIKDKDIIKAWIKFLVLQVLDEPIDYKLFAINKNLIETLIFTAISKEQALQQLEIYIKDFITNKNQLTFTQYFDLTNFFKNQKTCKEFFTKYITQAQYTPKELEYLNRLDLDTLNWQEITQKTKDWFATLNKHKQLSQ